MRSRAGLHSTTNRRILKAAPWPFRGTAFCLLLKIFLRFAQFESVRSSLVPSSLKTWRFFEMVQADRQVGQHSGLRIKHTTLRTQTVV